MKILLDVNLSPLWVQFLETNGIESVHWTAIGRCDAPDSEILSYAAAKGLVVFTHDLDFGALLARSNALRPSVLQIRCQDVLPAAIGEIVLRAIELATSHLETGALVTVEQGRSRIRILPIG